MQCRNHSVDAQPYEDIAPLPDMHLWKILTCTMQPVCMWYEHPELCLVDQKVTSVSVTFLGNSEGSHLSNQSVDTWVVKSPVLKLDRFSARTDHSCKCLRQRYKICTSDICYSISISSISTNLRSDWKRTKESDTWQMIQRHCHSPLVPQWLIAGNCVAFNDSIINFSGNFSLFLP